MTDVVSCYLSLPRVEHKTQALASLLLEEPEPTLAGTALLTNGCINSLEAEGLSSGTTRKHWRMKSCASLERELGIGGGML